MHARITAVIQALGNEPVTFPLMSGRIPCDRADVMITVANALKMITTAASPDNPFRTTLHSLTVTVLDS